MRIPFYQHEINDGDIQKVVEVLKSPFLTTGQTVAEFERKFADFLDKRYCIGTTNWTSSAEITLRAWGIGEGDEVIVPTMSYVATAHCVERVGAKPVFVDSDSKTGLLDIYQLETLITPRTKAIIPVHLYGVLPDMKRLRQISDKYGIRILEDAAHAIESRREGYRTGTYGDSANFSFYATKNITCGEGGAIVTDDETLADHAQQAVRLGTNKAVSDRSRANRYQHYDADFISGKANMTNISAALLLGQIDRIDDIHARRKEKADYYEKQISDIVGVELPHIPDNTTSAHYLFVILLQAGVRERVFDQLAAAGIPAAINFRPIHLMKIYRERYGYKEGMLPVAENWGERCLTLPFYPSMPDEHIDYVCAFFRNEYQRIIGHQYL